ncbi:hypothetical protein JHK85_016543 [Glycine max]|nr:hypothetical protein JHK85_016543 [Glycine max]
MTALGALLGIYKFVTGLVKKAILAANGVSLILPLLDDSDSEIRETSIILLFLFSQHEPKEVVDYLFRPRRLEALIGFFENEENANVQMAAAGFLANQPKSEQEFTMKLIELSGLDAILSILKTGKMEAKENALNSLNTGSITTKARAATFIGDPSMSTPKLTVAPKPTDCCWLFRSSHVALCSAHGSVCSVNTTFCLLDTKTLPSLIKLLHGEVHATACEEIQTLSTLVLEDFPQRGARVSHDYNALRFILDILNWENLQATSNLEGKVDFPGEGIDSNMTQALSSRPKRTLGRPTHFEDYE